MSAQNFLFFSSLGPMYLYLTLISSGAAANGAVLTANGTGGATFATSSGGDEFLAYVFFN